jgi:hypothetical protein
MSETLFCYRHPQRETMLRCSRCGNPICASCAIHTPTGYRCPDCQQKLEKKFITATWHDYPLAFLITALASVPVSLLLVFLGTLTGFLGWFIAILVIPSAAAGIAEAARWVTRKRRAPWLFRLAAAGTVVGTLPAWLVALWINPFGMIYLLLYLLFATPIVYGRLVGIRLN